MHHLSKLKINLENQGKSLERHEVKVCENREHLEKRMKKWNDFRKRKNVIVENYVTIKRRQLIINQVLRLQKVYHFSKLAWVNYEALKEIRRKNMAIAFIGFKCEIKMRRIMRHHGGLQRKHRNFERNIFVLRV